MSPITRMSHDVRPLHRPLLRPRYLDHRGCRRSLAPVDYGQTSRHRASGAACPRVRADDDVSQAGGELSRVRVAQGGEGGGASPGSWGRFACSDAERPGLDRQVDLVSPSRPFVTKDVPAGGGPGHHRQVGESARRGRNNPTTPLRERRPRHRVGIVPATGKLPSSRSRPRGTRPPIWPNPHRRCTCPRPNLQGPKVGSGRPPAAGHSRQFGERRPASSTLA